MRKALNRINRRIDSWLFERGFHLEQVRALLRIQFWLAILVPVLLILYAPRTGVDFLAGAWLATANFYFLAGLIQGLVFVRKGATAILLFSFYLRLALTALVLAGLIVWFRASVIALLAGLSTVLVSILLWGGMYFFRKNSRRRKYGC